MKTLKELELEIKDLNDLNKDTNERISKDIEKLRLEEQKVKDNLKARILKEFKGIVPKVSFDEYHLQIKLGEEELLNYRYGVCDFKQITRELKDKLVSMYEEVFGEVKEIKKIPFAQYENCYAEIDCNGVVRYVGTNSCSEFGTKRGY